MNHISKTSSSNIDLSFVNETIKKLIAENKINDNFKIIEEPEKRDLIQSTDEAQTLVNDKLNETQDWSPTTPQSVDEKEELGILMIATIATLKRKTENIDRRKSLNLSKIQ